MFVGRSLGWWFPRRFPCRTKYTFCRAVQKVLLLAFRFPINKFPLEWSFNAILVQDIRFGSYAPWKLGKRRTKGKDNTRVPRIIPWLYCRFGAE